MTDPEAPHPSVKSTEHLDADSLLSQAVEAVRTQLPGLNGDEKVETLTQFAILAAAEVSAASGDPWDGVTALAGSFAHAVMALSETDWKSAL